MNLSVNKLREEFLNYFENNSHKRIHSSPLIPHNDPTMMFVNSGMVQFKNMFTGIETRDFTKATSCQKSVRAGGKHNDLENVGFTARHHTFFEMLGNFSFGDYFKEDAIKFAWDFLTKTIELDKSKLYVTIYHNDDEAFDLWKKITGFSDDRIIRISTNDNFWSMGDTGPCGPCSEIFYDHGDHIFGGLPGTADEDGDRYIEIWNMVFMQYDQKDKDTIIDLPKKSIDTGMGLERISAVIQGVHDNYDIDYFKELTAKSEYLTNTKCDGDSKFSHRVIADHLRSSSFLIADGVMPSNEGRGYVLRRIMRRAMRHAHQLGSKEPLLYKMLPTLVSQMGQAYPELKRAEEFIKEVLKSEEERFKTTLDKGLKLLENESSSIEDNGMLKGDVAFKLYDTYGFPVDLTEDILRQRNIKVDHDIFTKCMNEQRDRARKNWSGSGEDKNLDIWFDIKEKYGSTEFLGYKFSKSEASILSIILNDFETDTAKIGDKVDIITNQTPFYGESGGQMGDKGFIKTKDAEIEILDTKKILGSIISHKGIVKTGKISKGDNVTLEIDEKYRSALKRNHSATHILHKALRIVLGNHVAQKGSLVSFDKLRFDISHPKAITNDQILEVENIVNEVIVNNSDVTTKIMPTEDAIKEGALALFGEKYDDEVRVVSMGYLQESNKKYSTELCGGTHVSKTGDIGLFKIISESAIAAGVRRIEAITAFEALSKFRDLDNKMLNISELLKANEEEILEKVKNLQENNKLLENKIFDLEINSLIPTNFEILETSISRNNIKIFSKVYDEVDPKILRSLAEKLSKSNKNTLFNLFSKNNNKVSIVVSCSEEISKTYDASKLVKRFAENLGGKGGGGSKTLAQAGGNDVEPLSDIVKLLDKTL